MRMPRLLSILILLLAALPVRADDPQHVQDLRDWQALGLPIVSNWNTGGFQFDWHVEQVRSGNRFLPTVKLNILSPTSPSEIGPKLKRENEAFVRDNGIPLSIRTDNIATILTKLPRLPLAPDSIPNSPVVWTIKNGVLGDEAIADVFGPSAIWRRAGEQWGRSGLVTDLQRRFPDAPYIVLADNNESNVDKFARYVNGAPNPDYYPDRINSWLPQLETLSVRVRDYAASGKTPDDFRREFNVRTDAQYNGLFSGFNDSLTAWKGRLLTEAYGIGTSANDWDVKSSKQYNPLFGRYDGGGSALYVGSSITSDFTSPDWFGVYFASPIHLKAESLNPKHFREVFLNLSPGGCFGGYQAGKHEIITEERYAAHVQWLLWSLKGDRRPVNLRYWVSNANKPTSPLCDTDAARKIVTDAGYPELATATEEMPIRAVNAAVNKILDNPTLRKFWIDGKPVQTGTHPGNEIRYYTTNKPRVFPQPGDSDEGFRLLDCDLNTPRSQWIRQPGPNTRGGYNPISIKVWGTATESDGAYLVQLWSPCKLSGTCKVTIPGVDKLIEMPVPQPLVYRVVRAGWVVETIE